MGYYSQKDPDWEKKRLGTCAFTIGGYGCFITSSVNLAKKLESRDKDPVELNDWLVKNKGYANGCLLIPAKAGEYLKMKYKGSFKQPQGRYCIAETDHYKGKGVPQHFILLDTKKNVRIDPLDLDPSWEKNNYRIVSYRVFEAIKKQSTSTGPNTNSTRPDLKIEIITETPQEPEIKVVVSEVPVAPEKPVEVPNIIDKDVPKRSFWRYIINLLRNI